MEQRWMKLDAAQRRQKELCDRQLGCSTAETHMSTFKRWSLVCFPHMEVSFWNFQWLWDDWAPALVFRQRWSRWATVTGMVVSPHSRRGNLWKMKLEAVTCLALVATSLIAMVTSSRKFGRRKHKEVFLEENSRFKFGGWDVYWHR